jgi:Domain of unknown function (DUF4331)
MNTITRSMLILGLFAAACGSDSDGRGDDDSSGAADSSGGMTGATMTDAMTTSSMTTSPTTATTATTDDTDTADTGDEMTTGGDPFVFDDSAPEEFTQVDRMGMPAVATALITDKDDYNHASPTDDVAGEFVPQIIENVTALHAALDDDLMGLGLSPCDVDTCMAQGAPLVVPDVLHIDLGAAPGFPNGRQLADPVIDITLAVILLDLEVHDAGTLVGVPVNPPANDEEFLDEFPYMALPH